MNWNYINRKWIFWTGNGIILPISGSFIKKCLLKKFPLHSSKSWYFVISLLTLGPTSSSVHLQALHFITFTLTFTHTQGLKYWRAFQKISGTFKRITQLDSYIFMKLVSLFVTCTILASLESSSHIFLYLHISFSDLLTSLLVKRLLTRQNSSQD